MTTKPDKNNAVAINSEKRKIMKKVASQKAEIKLPRYFSLTLKNEVNSFLSKFDQERRERCNLAQFICAEELKEFWSYISGTQLKKVERILFDYYGIFLEYDLMPSLSKRDANKQLKEILKALKNIRYNCMGDSTFQQFIWQGIIEAIRETTSLRGQEVEHWGSFTNVEKYEKRTIFDFLDSAEKNIQRLWENERRWERYPRKKKGSQAKKVYF